MKWNQIPHRRRKAIKLQLAQRDGLNCCICGLNIESIEAATVEHKKKQRNGGTHELRNLGLAHAHCNYADKHDETTMGNVIATNKRFF